MGVSMEKPNECRWCGCGVHHRYPQAIIYKCWSSQQGSVWERSLECQIGVAEKRIQRAIDTLKAAKRYTVSPGPRNTLNWDPDPDGYVTDSPAVDEAIAILEGERDE